MHLSHPTTRLATAAAAVLAALAPAVATGANESASGDSAPPAIVLVGLGGDATAYVPGVTDSGTGVLRERERRGIEPTAASTAGSGFDLVGDDGAVALAGALAAAAVAASLALGAGARRRRILT